MLASALDQVFKLSSNKFPVSREINAEARTRESGRAHSLVLRHNGINQHQQTWMRKKVFRLSLQEYLFFPIAILFKNTFFKNLKVLFDAFVEDMLF